MEAMLKCICHTLNLSTTPQRLHLKQYNDTSKKGNLKNKKLNIHSWLTPQTENNFKSNVVASGTNLPIFYTAAPTKNVCNNDNVESTNFESSQLLLENEINKKVKEIIGNQLLRESPTPQQQTLQQASHAHRLEVDPPTCKQH